MINEWVFAIIAGAFGYQVHGWSGAFLALVAVVGLTNISNFFYTTMLENADPEHDHDPSRGFQRIRWTVFILVMVTIFLSVDFVFHN